MAHRPNHPRIICPGDKPIPVPARSFYSIVGGRFEPQRELRSGDICRVDLATDQMTGATVALKRLKGPYLNNPRSIQALKNEAVALSLADHRGIPKLIEASLEGVDPFIAMEAIHGRTFSINNLRYVEEVLRAGIEICSILSSLHVLGIVHRDLKPGNLILTDKRVYLVDFNISFVPGMPDLASGARKAIGTPEFMAPEQTYPQARVDHRADLYSLGVMIYTFVSGHYPYVMDADNRESYFSAHRIQEAVPLSVRNKLLPQSLSVVLARALEKDPAKRFQRADDMAAALSASLGECLRVS